MTGVHKGVIHIPLPYPLGFNAVVMALCSKASMKMLATIGLTCDPMAAPLFAQRTGLGKGNMHLLDRAPTAL